MKGQLRIDHLYAFVLVDDDGTEGVPAISNGIMLLPLMGADLARVADLTQLVERSPDFRGKRVTILKFSQRDTIGVIDRTTEPSTPPRKN